MSRRDSFEGRYEVQDGYAGQSRPQHFSIDASEIEEDMSDNDLTALYDDAAEEHFRDNITVGECNVDEFIAWARERMKNLPSALPSAG